MAIRFRKSKSLGGLGRVYLTKRGISLSLGPRGKSISIGKRGVYGNIGIPGTGLSYRKKLSGSSRRSNSNSTSAMSYKSSTNSGYNEVKDYTMKKPLLACGLLFVLLFILTLMPVAFIHQTAISTLIAFIWFFVFLAWVISVIWLPIAFIKARKSKKAKIQADKEYADVLAYQQKMEEEKQQAELEKAKTKNEEQAQILAFQQKLEAKRIRKEEADKERLRQLQKQVNELTSQYEAGYYPVIDNPPIILKKNEICYLQYSATMHVRSKTEGYDKKGQGTIYLTSQRVLFLSDDKTTTFLLRSLVEIEKTALDPVMLKLTKDNTIPKYFYFGKGIEIYDFYILLKFITMNTDD